MMESPHRRYNPLIDEWVLVSPHRTQRPWLGSTEPSVEVDRPDFDPDCYLCPGNERAGGVQNPAYGSTYVFANDFPALLSVPGMAEASRGLVRAEPVSGECRVVCFSPRHDITLAKMSPVEIEGVIAVWQSETACLGERYPWVQIFENHGAAMGASNPHPHGQIWATSYLPSIPAKEDACQRAYRDRTGGSLLQDYADQEVVDGDRVILFTDHWVWLVPFWAVWPFETILIPRRHVACLLDLVPEEVVDLAVMLGRLLRTYDRVFGIEFPYSMGWHGLPRSGESHWHLHAHFYPPLLRSATVRKHMVGFEMLAEPQRDITPEVAAARLREVVSP